jgi:hypothetical protein
VDGDPPGAIGGVSIEQRERPGVHARHAVEHELSPCEREGVPLGSAPVEAVPHPHRAGREEGERPHRLPGDRVVDQDGLASRDDQRLCGPEDRERTGGCAGERAGDHRTVRQARREQLQRVLGPRPDDRARGPGFVDVLEEKPPGRQAVGELRGAARRVAPPQPPAVAGDADGAERPPRRRALRGGLVRQVQGEGVRRQDHGPRRASIAGGRGPGGGVRRRLQDIREVDARGAHAHAAAARDQRERERTAVCDGRDPERRRTGGAPGVAERGVVERVGVGDEDGLGRGAATRARVRDERG